MRKSDGSSSAKRLTRSMRKQSPIDVDDDESIQERMQRREEIQRGKTVPVSVDEDEESEEQSSSSEDDDGIDDSAVDNQKHQMDYQDTMRAFSKMDVKGMRYLHRETMVKLGIAKDVDHMLQNCGLTQFTSNYRSTYKVETLQFLASIELHEFPMHDTRQRSDKGYSELTFTINKVHDTLTVDTTSFNPISCCKCTSNEIVFRDRIHEEPSYTLNFY